MLLLDVPNPGSFWVPLVAAARFMKNPTQSSLAQGLNRIARDFAPWLWLLLPWPMGACLGSSSSPDELLDLAERVEAGELGDIEDWRAAEKRWLTVGVREEDIMYMTDERWPFDKSMAERGFPLVASSGLDFDIVQERMSCRA
jgi:hypothetical protein